MMQVALVNVSVHLVSAFCKCVAFTKWMYRQCHTFDTSAIQILHI